MLTTRKDIEHWLSRCSEVCGFREYKINDDLVVDVNGTVNLADADLEEIPLQFGFVSESFHCENNKLKSLKGAPHTVGLSFLCFNNRLTTLEGGPKTVGAAFICSNNELTDLTGAPKLVGSEANSYYPGNGYFGCSSNPLLGLGEVETQLVGTGEFCFTAICGYQPSFLPELSSFQHHDKSRLEKVSATDFNATVNALRRIREEKALFESSIAKVVDTQPLGEPTNQAVEPQQQPRAKQKFKL